MLRVKVKPKVEQSALELHAVHNGGLHAVKILRTTRLKQNHFKGIPR